MYAMATLWRDGREIWRIEHHGDRVREDLKVTGKPPEEFEAIRSDYAVKQKSDGQVDWYFEMPVELAKRMTGFKHDESNEALDDKFEELKGMVQAEAAGRRSRWKFW
jgi:hypothetical protein